MQFCLRALYASGSLPSSMSYNRDRIPAMIFKNTAVLLSAVLSCALLATTGCTSRPKLDLTGMQVNPSAADKSAGDEFGGDAFVPGSDEGLNGGVRGMDGDGDSVKGGAWGDSSQAVQPLNAGSLKNARRWDAVVVYFAYNQSELEASQRAKLDTLLAFLNDNAGKGLIIEGHTDERGSDEYNRALGERRSLSVKNYLVNCGIAEGRIETVSYGEDKPVVPNAATESDHQLNRRCEFVIGDL